MRKSSQIYIYIDVQKAIDTGINFYMSSNGVVLSDGDATGYIHPQFFQQVRNAKGNVLTDYQSSIASIEGDDGVGYQCRAEADGNPVIVA